MEPPKFLVGKLGNGRQAWASIDPRAHHTEAAIAERRFSAYMRPFRDEEAARRALIAAGAQEIAVEEGRHHGR